MRGRKVAGVTRSERAATQVTMSVVTVAAALAWELVA